MAKAQSLSELDLSENQLEAVPPELNALSALRELQLQDNRIARLPDELSGLRSLRILRMQNNPLASLPDSLLANTPLHSLGLGLCIRARALRARAVR